MADRITKIILRGDISDLQAKMVAAGKSVGATADKITNASKESKKWRDGLSSVGDTAGKMGLVAAAGVGVVIGAAANFDSAMSKVQAATHESASNMDALRAAAIKAGADTVFSATEAADAITAMSKAGVQTKDILAGGLNGALSLASAGELDVAQSAEIAATAMTQFGLSGKDIPHIADLLAAGAGKAQGEVTDFAQALKYVGPVAHQMGISIEETTGVIAELASQGILADQAGTSLRGVLTSLTSPSKQAATEMQSLGIELYNTQGKFVGFDGVAAQLQKSMGNLTNAERDQALGRIFGNEQITAARILYAGGAADVDKWTKAVNDQGYAAETAAIKMDNLKGDLEQLKGSLETAFIGAGEGAQSPLRGLVQGATDATNALNALPGPIKNAGVAMLGLVAITGGGLWFTAKAVNGVASMRLAIESLGVSSARTSAALSMVGRAATIAGGALAGLAVVDAVQGGGLDKSLPTLNELAKTLQNLGTAGSPALPKQFNDLADAIDRIGDPNAAQALQDKIAGVIGFGGGDDVKNYRQQIEALDAALANLVSADGAGAAQGALLRLASTQKLSKGQVADLVKLMPQYRDALAGASRSEGDAASGAKGAADAIAGLAGAADDATAKAYTLQNAMDLLFGKVDVDAALVSWRRGIRGLTKDLKGGADAFNTFTKQGDDNRDAIRGQVQNLRTWAEAQYNVDGSTKKLTQRLLNGREAIIKQAEAAGIGKKQTEAYLKQLGLTPKEIRTDVKLIGTPLATDQINGVVIKLSKLDKMTATATIRARDLASAEIAAIRNSMMSLQDKTINIRTVHTESRLKGPGYATGGYITGAGTGTSDSIPAWLSNGEYVINARATAQHRALLDAINGGQRRGYADGGYVDRAVVAQAASNTTVINNHGGSMPSAFTLMLDGRTMRAYVSGVADDVFTSRDTYSRTTRGHR